MKYKQRLTTFIVASLSFLLLLSCGATQSAADKAQNAEALGSKIANMDFKFSATYAYPQNFRSVYLSPYYDVTVSSDTVKCYLPYYGRAYTAPMNPSEGGIKFTSTSFDYDIKNGKKAGNWMVTIRTKDTTRPFTLVFNLWSNGTGRLSVDDPDRQTISFQGNVE